MKRYFLFIVCCLVMRLAIVAQVPEVYPSIVEFAATFVNHDGEVEEIGEEGGAYDAPLTVRFSVELTDTMGFEPLYEWNIIQIKDNKEAMHVRRNGRMTEFTFKEGGDNISYRVELNITCRYRADEVYSCELTGDYPITFSLQGSSVQLFNAFSPNGDGTNDVFRVKTQSLLSFRMKIFNRWGQEIISGNQDSLPIEYTNADGTIDGFTYYVCWDGTYHGRMVEDGVYFILVEAEGSDGIKYVRRGDINILTSSKKEEKQ